MPDIVFEVGQRRLVRGIQSRESIDPSDPIERVRALPSEPLQALHERVSGPRADPYRTGHGHSLELPANSSPKHPWLAARARVAWLASSLLLAERQTEGRNSKMTVPLIALTRAGAWGLLARLVKVQHPRMNRSSPGGEVLHVGLTPLHAQ